MPLFLWHQLTPKCTWPSQNKHQNSSQKIKGKLCPQLCPPFHPGRGHNCGNDCTGTGTDSSLALELTILARVLTVLAPGLTVLSLVLTVLALITVLAHTQCILCIISHIDKGVQRKSTAKLMLLLVLTVLTVLSANWRHPLTNSIYIYEMWVPTTSWSD